jgi:hypothetical protein
MNIALCLSGQPRDLELGIKSIINNIINPNKDCNFDIFCHYWFDEKLINTPFDSAQERQNFKLGVWDSRTHDLINKLNPKDICCEKPKKFEEFNPLTLTPDAQQPKLASLFYSLWFANEMKKFYEIKQKTKYDLVIRARYDLYFFKPIILNQLFDKAKKHLIVSTRFQEIRTEKFNGGLTLTDLFAISNSTIMDIFSDVYPNFYDLYHQMISNGSLPLGENYLGQQVRVNNKLDIYHTTDIDFNLVRNI